MINNISKHYGGYFELKVYITWYLLSRVILTRREFRVIKNVWNRRF